MSSTESKEQHHSHVFAPYRALGLVVGSTRCAFSFPSDKHCNAVVPVGAQFHEYVAPQLRCLRTSALFDEPIRYSDKCNNLNAIATGAHAVVMKFNNIVYKLEHSPIGSVTHVAFEPLNRDILTIGSNNTMSLWRIRDGTRATTVVFPPQFFAHAFCFPSGCGTKVIVGSPDGRMILWDYETEKLIYEFPVWPAGVSALCSCHIKEVIGVGLSNGSVVVYNIGHALALRKYRHVPAFPISGLAFKAEGSQLLATGADDGSVAIWNLDEDKLETMLTPSQSSSSGETAYENAHRGRVHSLAFFPKLPYLITCGADNAMRVYEFDLAKGATLRTIRQGHSGEARQAAFCSAACVLSAGRDKMLRKMHVYTDAFSVEVSQGNIMQRSRKLGCTTDSLKLDCITSISSSTVREKDWPTIATTHEGRPGVRIWSLSNNVLEDPPLNHKTPVPTEAVITTISLCATLCVVGFADGSIQSFNLQSKQFRHSYEHVDLEVEVKRKGLVQYRAAHSKRITGLHVDRHNKHLISVSLDFTIKIWDLKEGTFLKTIKTGMEMNCSTLDLPNGLLAVACEDNAIRIYDIDLLHIEKNAEDGEPVRLFRGHTSTIRGLLYTHDSLHLLSACEGNSLRVWQIPSRRLVDVMKFHSQVTSISLQEDDLLLSTTHKGESAVFIWSNKLKFGLVTSAIDNIETSNWPITVLPSYCPDPEDKTAEEPVKKKSKTKKNKDVTGEDINLEIDEETQKEDHVTFSTTALPKWSNLPYLSIIRKRSQPVLPAQKYVSPFILATKAGVHRKPLWDLSAAAPKTDAPKSRILKNTGESDSDFVGMIKKKKFDAALAYLLNLGESKVELELRNADESIPQMLDFFTFHIRRRHAFEAVQSCLSVFLKLYGEEIAGRPESSGQLAIMREAHESSWRRCSDTLSCLRASLEFLV